MKFIITCVALSLSFVSLVSEAKEPKRYAHFREAYERAEGFHPEDLQGQEIWEGSLYYHLKGFGFDEEVTWLAIAPEMTDPMDEGNSNALFGTFTLKNQVWPGPQDRTVGVVFTEALHPVQDGKVRFSKKDNALVITAGNKKYFLRQGKNARGGDSFFLKEYDSLKQETHYGYFHKVIFQEKSDGSEYVAASCAAELTTKPVNRRPIRVAYKGQKPNRKGSQIVPSRPVSKGKKNKSKGCSGDGCR